MGVGSGLAGGGSHAGASHPPSMYSMGVGSGVAEGSIAGAPSHPHSMRSVGVGSAAAHPAAPAVEQLLQQVSASRGWG